MTTTVFISHASTRCYPYFFDKISNISFHFSRQREMLPSLGQINNHTILSFLTHARDATIWSISPAELSSLLFLTQAWDVPAAGWRIVTFRLLSFLTQARDVTKRQAKNYWIKPFISHASARCYRFFTVFFRLLCTFISHARARCYRNIERPYSI